MKNYNPNIYIGDLKNRYALGETIAGGKNLLCIGVNPSIANNLKSDTTISKIKKFMASNGYDGWIMINLYPQVATDAKDIHTAMDNKIHKENLKQIKLIVDEYKPKGVLACWGNLIASRNFFAEILPEIYDQIGKSNDIKWSCINKTKAGHPSHPSRARYCEFSPFDVEEYVIE